MWFSLDIPCGTIANNNEEGNNEMANKTYLTQTIVNYDFNANGLIVIRLGIGCILIPNDFKMQMHKSNDDRSTGLDSSRAKQPNENETNKMRIIFQIK